MSKLWLLFVFICGLTSINCMEQSRKSSRLKNQETSKNKKNGLVSSRRKKRKTLPTILTISDDIEKKVESDDEEEDVKPNLNLAQFLHQLSETDGEGAMENVALMKDKFLDRLLAIKEKKIGIQEKMLNVLIKQIEQGKQGVTLSIDDMVIKINGKYEMSPEAEGMFG